MYYLLNFLPSRSLYYNTILKSNYGRASGLLGVKLTKINPPRLSISSIFTLFSIIYEGNIEAIFVTINSFPSFLYVFYSSVVPYTLIELILSDINLMTIS